MSLLDDVSGYHRERLRIQRDERYPNTDVNIECFDDPVVELISIWISEFLKCTEILEERSDDHAVIQGIFDRLRELEKKICVVLKVTDPGRVGLVAKAVCFAKRAKAHSSAQMIANQDPRVSSVGGLETLYTEHTRKIRSSSHRPEKSHTRAIYIINRSFRSGNPIPKHISLSRFNMSDVNLTRLWQGLEMSVGINNVVSLDLSLNQLSSALSLIGILRGFPHLESLDLRRNRFSDPIDIISLATYISTKPNFKEIDLRENLITLSILSISLWFHIDRYVIDTDTFTEALGKIRVTTNKTCRDILS